MIFKYTYNVYMDDLGIYFPYFSPNINGRYTTVRWLFLRSGVKTFNPSDTIKKYEQKLYIYI